MQKGKNKKFLERKKRASKIVRELKRLFPKTTMALRYRTQWELLVAVVLSAQTTDKKVNEVTVELFKKYRTLNDYVKAGRKEFEKEIKEIGLHEAKAKNILSAAKIIKEKYRGKLPRTMEAMIALPGVGRKTANVVLGNAYGIVEGIAVDTHVRRFAIKLDLSDHKTPDKIEKDLMGLLPQKEWFGFTYRVIEYGRKICPARPHPCENHPLSKIYPPSAKRWPKK